jgi:hypothetical protein
MPSASDRPLQKVTLNLFRDDVAEMVAAYGQGWTGQVRLLVEKHIAERKRFARELRETMNGR